MNSNKVFEQLYSQIDHFFMIEGEIIKKGKSDVKVSSASNINCIEWELNQKYSDIAVKDLNVLFNLAIPHFLRKIFVAVNQFLLFYFLTDQEIEIKSQYEDDQNIIHNRFNNHFILFINPVREKIIKSQCFIRFIHSLDKIFRRIYFYINNEFYTSGIRQVRNINIPQLACIFKASGRIIINTGLPKLRTDILFHKRN